MYDIMFSMLFVYSGYASISTMNIDGKFSIPHQSSLANIKVRLSQCHCEKVRINLSQL